MDRRTEQEYREALDGLRFSDGAKERMMNDLMEQQMQKEPVKRRSVRTLRAGLIAAALCVAMLGTAGAAQFLGARIDWQAEDPLRSGGSSYGAKVDTTCFPADSFPQQIQDMAGQGSLVGKNFKSWAELEEFLGQDLPDSAALGSAKPGPRAVVSGTEKGGTNILLCVSTCKQGIFSIEATGHYVLDGIWIEQEARIYTDKAEENYKEIDKEFESGDILIYEDGSEMMTDETYTTPNGLTATIVTVVLPEGHGRSSTRYNAHFSISGIQYRVTASFYRAGMTGAEAAAAEDPAHTLAVLKQVLDDFQV